MVFKFLEDVICDVLEKVAEGIDATGEALVRGIDHLETAVEYARENPVRTTVAVAAVAATGGALGAGAIASALGSMGWLGVASTGAEIVTLHGIALESAALAYLGGGAVAAGGGGMALGSAVVSGVSGVVGGAVTAATVS